MVSLAALETKVSERISEVETKEVIKEEIRGVASVGMKVFMAEEEDTNNTTPTNRDLEIPGNESFHGRGRGDRDPT